MGIRRFTCEEHKDMVIVYQEHTCPLCKYFREIAEAHELATEALGTLSIEDTAAELSEVADTILKAMEDLRRKQ